MKMVKGNHKKEIKKKKSPINFPFSYFTELEKSEILISSFVISKRRNQKKIKTKNPLNSLYAVRLLFSYI